MKSLTKYTKIVSLLLISGVLFACTQTPPAQQTYSLQNLPAQFNSPASFALDANNNILFTSPNLHNQTLIEKRGHTKCPSANDWPN